MIYVLVFSLGFCLGMLVVLGAMVRGHFDKERNGRVF